MTARKTTKAVLAELAEAARKESWGKRKAAYVQALFARREFYYLGDLADWLDRQYFYDAPEAPPKERARVRRAYRIVFGKPFKPETFAHRSLSSSPELMRTLTHAFGSQGRFKEYVEKGGALDLESAYAAALFGFLPMERVQEYAPRNKKLKK